MILFDYIPSCSRLFLSSTMTGSADLFLYAPGSSCFSHMMNDSPQDKMIVDGMKFAEWREISACLRNFYGRPQTQDLTLPRRNVGLYPPTAQVFANARM